jgi:hypothetical protein
MASKSAPRLITAAMAARLSAAFDALSGEHEGAGTGRPDWWQGVADAHQELAEALSSQADAMFAALSTARAASDAPERVLIQIVDRVAYTHRKHAEDARAQQACRDQDRAFATYADNIRASQGRATQDSTTDASRPSTRQAA